MANIYKTPGVYIEEIPKLPASVAQVETAIPAFIGYTEKAIRDGEDLTLKPTRITTLLEYQNLFGDARKVGFDIKTGSEIEVTINKPLLHLMYYNLDIYFINGGGPCYIVSIGDYSMTHSKSNFVDGIDVLAKEDEPTLFVLSDAAILADADYFALCQQALLQCSKLKDRFCIFDVKSDDLIPYGKNFRDAIGMSNLKYGSAYFPYLKTALNYAYDDDQVDLDVHSFETADVNGIKITSDIHDTKVKIRDGAALGFGFTNNNKTLTITVVPADNTTGTQLVTEWQSEAEKHGFTIVAKGDGSAVTVATPEMNTLTASSLDGIKTSETALYNQIKAKINKVRVILPPSAVVAGVYARVDSNRGVWKAPANVSLNSVIEPIEKITHEAQENLNVDTTGGKSINAIRSFTGKGVMVWGARTLAGNDNEWRYIPVRRLFNMVEESVKKATEFVVFEPNDANTWVRVKAMIENYLTGLWRAGALAGAKTDQAFFVNVGLGTTMTTVDILEGRMIIEIGMAAIRPAEFIILRFSHKLQEV